MNDENYYMDANSVDLSKTEFDKFVIIEEITDSEYIYTCNYDIKIQFKNIKTNDPKLNKVLNKSLVTKSGQLEKEYDSRPELISKMVTKSDDEYGTQSEAIEDFINENLSSTASKLQLLEELFNANLPQIIFNAAINGTYSLCPQSKLQSIEFDYRKPTVKTMSFIYEDGDIFNVQLNTPITNDMVDEIFPEKVLPSLYVDIDDMLKDNYDETVKSLSKLVGFDVTTLKGAKLC